MAEATRNLKFLPRCNEVLSQFNAARRAFQRSQPALFDRTSALLNPRNNSNFNMRIAASPVFLLRDSPLVTDPAGFVPEK
jgi:hypothetical protein